MNRYMIFDVVRGIYPAGKKGLMKEAAGVVRNTIGGNFSRANRAIKTATAYGIRSGIRFPRRGTIVVSFRSLVTLIRLSVARTR